MLKTPSWSLRSLKEGCERMEEKAAERLAGWVSVGKVSMTASGAEERREVANEVRFVGLRARRAMARFP